MNRNLLKRKALRVAMLVLMLNVIGMTNGYAYDFSAVCSTGQTLYYNITDATNHYVSITYPGSSISNPWNGYSKPKGNIEIPEYVAYGNITYTVTTIGPFSFYGSGLTGSLIIPNSIVSISSSAFSNSTGLSSVTFGNSLERIGTNAFSYCTGLTGSLIIPNSVNSIYEYAFACTGFEQLNWNAINVSGYGGNNPFSNCSNLTTVIFGDLVQSIPSKALYSLSSLTSVTFGGSVTSIGADAFKYDSGLTTVNYTGNLSQWCGINFGNEYSNPFYLTNTWIINGTPLPDQLVVPSDATSIGNYVFYCCSGLTSVSIGDSVTSIGDYAFYRCSGLTSVTIGESVTSIGDRAFYDCNGLAGLLIIPNSVVSIGEYAYAYTGFEQVNWNAINVSSYPENSPFSNCSNLTTVIFGDSVQSIPSKALYSLSSLTSVTFGGSVISIGADAFKYDSGLTTVNYTGNLSQWCEINFGNEYSNPFYLTNTWIINGTPLSGQLIIPSDVTSIGNYAFYRCSGLASVTIGESVVSIGNYTFSRCSGLALVTIGESVVSIGNYAFQYCNALTQINWNAINVTTYPNNVLNYLPFRNCANLTSVVFGDVVQNIPEWAFYDCTGLSSVTIGNSVISIGAGAFYRCTGLSSVTFGDSLQTIGASAFYDCGNLQEVAIGEGVTTIGGGAFWGCNSLTTVNFNATNCIRMQTASGSNYNSVFPTTLTTINIGSNVTNIPNYAFEGASGVTNMVIPNAVTNVGCQAFFNCDSLQEVTIGEGVATIGEKAFWNCPALTKVRFNAVNCNTMKTLYNDGCYSVFSTDGEGEHPAITTLIIGTNVGTIPDYAFTNSTGLQRLIIPASVETIGNYAFFGCEGLVRTNIQGAALDSIGDYAFAHCSDMVCTLTLSNNVKYIGEGAFYNCSALTGTPVVPSTAIAIGKYTYYNCHNLTGSLSIPSGIASIGEGAFYNCSGLNGSLTMSNKVTSIGSKAFFNCNGLTGNLVVPDNVAAIGSGAFYNCSGLNGWINIPRTTTFIGDSTFYNCVGLTGNVIVPQSITSIGEGAFYNCSGLVSIISECSTVPVAQSTSFENMDYSIPVYVPYGKIPNYQNAPGWNVFANYVEQFQYESYDNNNWSDEYNWYTFELPTASDVVCISSDCQLDVNANVLYLYMQGVDDILIIENGKVLTSSYGIGTTQTSQLLIEDGGQLVSSYGNIVATVRKNIMEITNEEDGWYLISSPLLNNIAVNSVDNLLSNEYDLYYYNEPTCLWMNQKYSDNLFSFLDPGKGYLYANSQEVNLDFSGFLNSGTAMITIPLDYTYSAGELRGFNLIGNPFVHNITSYTGNNVAEGCYRMNETRDNLIVSEISTSNPLKPAEGFFVKATGEGASVTFNQQTRGLAEKSGYINLELSSNGKLIDRLMVRDRVEPLEKLSLGHSKARLFVVKDHQEMAIVPREGNEQPIYFKTAKNGTYTITVNLEGMELNYLHLIDHKTGANVNLLAEPSYSFEARNSDYESRFQLVYSLEGGNGSDDEPFAFISNGQIVVNGTGTLQIFDVTGRMISSQNANNNISINGMSAGVYMLHLVNNDNVKIQKIVIK